MRLVLLILCCLALRIGVLSSYNYLKGICLTAKRSGCDSWDKPVSIKTQNNFIIYCNECKACQIHNVIVDI